MRFFRKLFGGGDETPRINTMARPTRLPMSEDELAVERYRYMLRTAPPETIEQAHAEAFARLTLEQRQLALQELSTNVPASERSGATSNPQSLARLATRAEMRQPGTLERSFGDNRGGIGGGMGMGGMIAGTLLASVAGTFIGTAIASEFFAGDTGFDGGADAGTDAPAEDRGADAMAAHNPGFDSGFEDVGGDFGEF